jgi:hypothetical protein
MTQDQPVIRIGELLVLSGVITTYDLSEAEKLSTHMKVQFGRLLIMAGCLTEEALECALEAQGLIKDGLITAQIASEALAFAVQENIPFRQALEVLDCLPQFGTSTLRLAELIHDANIIEEERLHDAFDTSMETNRPLPEVLVEMECISPGLLSIMLRMQEQIRNDTLDREDSINELRGTFKIWKRADKAMANDPMSKSAIISAAPTNVDKPSRFTSSFDTVNRLPAMSAEILASLNKESKIPVDDSTTKSLAPSAFDGAAENARQPLQPGYSAQSPASSNASSSAGSYGAAQPPGAAAQSGTSAAAQGQTPLRSGGGPQGSYTPASNSSPSASTRGGNDELNVDWILNDYANAPAGQPMPDGVILYSPGYFPPDPQKTAPDESFSDGFSDEDEQRINDLLDVFASDAPPAVPPIVGAPNRGPLSAAKPGENYASAGTANQHASRESNFAQSSYSASLAAAAADGWGVPDLAAAGAHLSGAEMFARAQAELASSGWAYSPGAGQPSQFPSVTPSSNPSSSSSSSSTSTSQSPSSSPAGSSPSAYAGDKTPAPLAPVPLGQPSYVTPSPPSSPTARPPLSAPPSAPSSAPAPGSPSEKTSTAPWGPPPGAVVPDPPVAHTAPETPPLSPSVVALPMPANESAVKLPSEPKTESTDDGLFSAQLKESISGAIQGNPFKIRKVGEIDSSSNLSTLPSLDKVDFVESKSADASSADVVDEASAKVEQQIEQKLSSDKEANLLETDALAEHSLIADEEHGHKPEEFSPEIAEQGKSDISVAEKETSELAHSNKQDAHEKSGDKVQVELAAAPKGKFGTKTGLAAKRKAEELSEEASERNDVVYLLKSANFFSADELEDAIVNSLRDQNKAIEILGILGIIDKSNLDAAVRLQKLVKAGSVHVSKAVESLKDLQSGKLRPSELTEQLGIKKAKRRK